MVRYVSGVFVCLILGGAFALAFVDRAQIRNLAFQYLLAKESKGASPRRMWDSDYFTNTPVLTHDGRKLRFYDDLIKDKIVVINFIYTSCRDICSLATARLAQVRDRLGDRVGRDVFFYSITLDPVIDGPEVLQKYAANFYSGPGWLFLTGKADDIARIRHKLGERSKTRGDHRNDVLLGNDATGEWGRDSIFSDPEHLMHTILRMDPREREAPTMTVATAHNDGAPGSLGHVPGRALFVKACAACHHVGGGDHIGPDLAGVTERRSQDWLVRFIISPNKMFDAGDETALGLLERYRGLRMPELGLNETDANDVITFLKSTAARDGSNASLGEAAP